MEEALSFFRAFEVWVYLLLGLGGLIYIRKFILAWQELREAGFGLERESAQDRLNRSASVLVLLLTMAVAEFILVSFIAPAVPGATPLPTSTLDLLATPSVTLPPTTPLAEQGTVTVAPADATTATATMPATGSGCFPEQIMITSPQNGQEVSGVVEVKGTADISSFGFYKLEMRRPDESIWATIQAGDQVKQGGDLGFWDTRLLAPGVYQLSLVVVDNQGQPSQPCIVEVSVATEVVTTPVP